MNAHGCAAGSFRFRQPSREQASPQSGHRTGLGAGGPVVPVNFGMHALARRTLFSPFGFLACLLAALALGTAADLVHAAPPRSGTPAPSAAKEDFRAFVESIWLDARAAGISRETFDAAFAGVQADPKIVALTTKQSEFSRPIWDYVTAAASAARIAKGRSASEQWDSSLNRIESRYGVPREVVLAVWGMESGFGANTGGFYVIRSLATLAVSRMWSSGTP